MRLDCTECVRKFKEHEADVVTMFVQMRIYLKRDMLNSPFYSPPSPLPKLQRVEKIGNKALQLCQYNSLWHAYICFHQTGIQKAYEKR